MEYTVPGLAYNPDLYSDQTIRETSTGASTRSIGASEKKKRSGQRPYLEYKHVELVILHHRAPGRPWMVCV